MGYDTAFYGRFAVTPALKPEHLAYLTAFAETRHVSHNPGQLATVADPVREAVKLPLGPEGMFFVGKLENADLRGREECTRLPGLYCHWVPTGDGRGIEWDGTEKFDNYVEWMRFQLNTFLLPWGYSVSGTVEWQGDEPRDRGQITVKAGSCESEGLPIDLEEFDEP